MSLFVLPKASSWGIPICFTRSQFLLISSRKDSCEKKLSATSMQTSITTRQLATISSWRSWKERAKLTRESTSVAKTSWATTQALRADKFSKGKLCRAKETPLMQHHLLSKQIHIWEMSQHSQVQAKETGRWRSSTLAKGKLRIGSKWKKMTSSLRKSSIESDALKRRSRWLKWRRHTVLRRATIEIIKTQT